MDIFKKDILKLADEKKEIEYKDASLFVLKNNKQEEYKYMFAFLKLSEDKNNNLALFKLLDIYLAENGIKKIIGPIDYSTWFSYRIALNYGDISFFPDEPYNKDIRNILKELGYKELPHYKSLLVELQKNLSNKTSSENEYEYLYISGNDCLKYTEEIYEISVDGFNGAFLYTDISYEAYVNIYLKRFENIINPDLVLVKKRNIPVAYFFGYMDPSRKYYICKTIAVKTEFRMKMNLISGFIDIFDRLKIKYDNPDFVFHYQKDILFKKIVRHVKLIKEYSLFEKEF